MNEDWIECTLEDVGEIFSGGTPKTGEPTYWADEISWISPSDLSNYTKKYIDKGKKSISKLGLKKSSAKLFPKNTVLFSCRAPIGYTVIANKEMCTNQGFKSIHPYDGVDSEYIYYFLTSSRQEAEKVATGTTFKEISKTAFSKLLFPLPPLVEQKAIVNKIEELFGSLDSGIADLKKAQEQLVIYRQAVLKKAFEGELTREWREKQTNLPSSDELLERIKKERQEHYETQVADWKQAVQVWEKSGITGKKPSRITRPKKFPEVKSEEVETYDSIPNSWFWTRFGSITYKIGDIDHKMPKTVEKGMPYISTGNIGKDGKIDFDNAKQISREDFDRLALKIKPEKGDIIFPRYGTIGRNMLIDFDKEFLVSYSCAIIKNITKVMDEKFTLYFSLSPVIKREINRYVVETTQANIGITSIESFVYPLCSKQEQHQIVREIESRLSVCDKIEESIKDSLEKAEALRQSILKKAFEGKLLSSSEIAKCKQAKDYEPASVLLEKIKKEKNG